MNPVFRVVKKSPLAMVVDSGRFGYQAWGYPQSGAMDRISAEVGNRALGNASTAPILEITLLGPVLKVLSSADILVTGADLSATVNDTRLPLDTVVTVKSGDILKFGRRQSGCRAYLAVRGGFVASWLLESASPLSSVMQGRKLPDILAADPDGASGAPSKAAQKALAHWRRYWSETAVLDFVWGPQAGWFTEQSGERLINNPYTITPKSSRVGLTLDGPRLSGQRSLECLSDPSPLGAIQVPPSGIPLVLLNDRGTIGGYAKLGTVVSYDCWRAAQLAPGTALRFRAVPTEHRVADEHLAAVLEWMMGRGGEDARSLPKP